MRSLLTIVVCMLNSIVFGQVYSGNDFKEMQYQHFCELKINKDSSVFFIYHDKNNTNYHEYAGNIKRINDTLYKISATSTFDKNIHMGRPGVISIHDNDDFVTFNKVTLKYKDGYKVTYDLNKSPVITKKNDSTYYHNYRKIRLDPKHFYYRDSMNDYDGYMQRVATTDVYLDVGHKSPISGKPVYFRTIDCGNDFYFGGRKTTFSVISKEGKIKLINDSLGIDAGPFTLKKQI